MTKRNRRPIAERLAAGLKESIEHAKRERDLRTTAVASEPPEVDARTLAVLRRRAEMSQRQLAGLLNVSLKTLQSWEQGVRTPSQASRRLIEVFAREPAAVCRTAGLPDVELPGVRVVTGRGGKRKLQIAGTSKRRGSTAVEPS